MIICCPVCGSDDAARFLEANTAEGPLLVQRCRRCEHGFLERQPEKFEADRYEYYRKYLGKPLELRQRPLNERRFDDLLSTWGPQVAGRRLLDLGCGDGQMVRVANDRGWQAEGLDLSASARLLHQPHQRSVLKYDKCSASMHRQSPPRTRRESESKFGVVR
jgi:SAM-dependent methyltransferase